MKFALVSGQRQEAQPNLAGKCQTCDQPMVAKCGEVRIWHWAHLGGRLCDPWWENETVWHRAWKNRFPIDWQEVVHYAETGEKHISDVNTDRGWIIEFQHSYLKPEERRSRDTFYRKLIWVVDGTRRKRDVAQLLNAWNEGAPMGANSLLRRAFSHNCTLLRDWAGGNTPIFFDLGEAERLWWLVATSTNGLAYLAPYSRAKFIESHRGGAADIAREFDAFVNDIPKLLSNYESQLRAQSLQYAAPRPLRRSFRF
jgi:competence protein CoiA